MKKSEIYSSNLKWFSRLVQKEDAPARNCLMSNYSATEIASGLLVCAITEVNSHIFTLFDNYIKFVRFQNKIPLERRCFFEIALGDRLQKPHFDLDISQPELLDKSEDILHELIDTIIIVFNDCYQKQLNLATDLLLFTSHGANKRSYHIIIDNYAHSSNEEAKAFFNKVVEKLPPTKLCIPDESVYSKKQQFRIVGSQKLGSARIKTFVTSWKYKDTIINYQWREEPTNPSHRLCLTLEASLLTTTKSCSILPNLLTISVSSEYKISLQRDIELTKSDVEKSLSLLSAEAKLSFDHPSFPYSLREVKGSLIILKRKHSSRCKICQRVHEHENPYLIVVEDSNGIKTVYFKCRRAEDKSLLLGTLSIDSPSTLRLKEEIEQPIEPKNFVDLGERLKQRALLNKQDETVEPSLINQIDKLSRIPFKKVRKN